MEILEKILNDTPHRKQLIAEFQKMIWDNANSEQLLLNLAYDLEFYEQDDELRKGDVSYYDDERLEREIIEVLKKIKYK